ncbi:MAG: O-antigen ligase family protein, partial [Gammaproteobacteria bacterium]|nr:O-antigen ligase family protein [Gammaproteobacteria bacterium]
AWTGSKGPLLALTGVLALAIWQSLRGRGRVAFALVALSATAALVGLFAYAIIDLGSSRLMAIVDILTWNRSAFESRTSAGVRLLAYVDTIDLILRHPFGAGLGSWSYYIDTGFGLYYPHNLFLEVLSESGILAGSIALIPFLLFVVVPGPLAFRSAAFFFLLAQQVSGDLLDARYLLVFSTLCCWYRWQIQPRQARQPQKGCCAMPQSLRPGYV